MTPLEFLREFAPVAGNEARADFLVRYFSGPGEEPEVDEVGNVIVGSGPLAFAAHIDTVLEPAPLTLEEERWWGPAIGDNSSGVAVLATAWEKVPKDVTLVFPVGEEGLGNLLGARTYMKTHTPEAFVAVDGYLGGVVVDALGSLRMQVEFRGPGGHSWGDRSAPNPAFALGRLIRAVEELPVGERQSRSVARVWGGEAINAIPREVGLTLDVRATEEGLLKEAEGRLRQQIMEAAAAVGVEAVQKVLGRRPAGRTATPELIECARAAALRVGFEAKLNAGSTDMAAAVEKGVPAVTLGAYRGGGAHTTAEWVDPASLASGRELLLAFYECWRSRRG
ncbi:M20/M25/M40 family metallo-hydrolase [Oceanithermus sp.]